MKAFKFFFENPPGNRNLEWIDLKIPANNYIIGVDELELLKDCYISNRKFETETPLWVQASPADLPALLDKRGILNDKSVGIILDLSRHRFAEDLTEITRLKEELAIPLMVEITAAEQLKAVDNYSHDLDGIIVKGFDSSAFVSDLTTAVLARLALQETDLPVYARGGVGSNTVLAYYVSGCAGVVIDTQILLLEQLGLPEVSRNFIARHEAGSTVLLGSSLDLPYRVSAFSSKSALEELTHREKEIFLEDSPLVEKQRQFLSLIEKYSGSISGGIDESKVIPVGQDTFLAKRFRRHKTIAGVTWELTQKIKSGFRYLRDDFPLRRHNDFCRQLNIELPLIQGPMANISDSVPFAAKVAAGGALPVFACGGKRKAELEQMFNEINRCPTPFNYGVGLIGFDPEMDEERHLDAVIEQKPPVVILAGAKAKQVHYLEEHGIQVFVHAPVKESFEYFLSCNARNYIFEGHEAGGHVGSLSLMVIIESILDSLDHQTGRINPAELTMVFAGGINDALSALMLNAAVVDFHRRGVKIGCQMGTAYLATQEAAELSIITKEYQEMILQHDRTMVIGESVHLPLRLIPNKLCRDLCHLENQLQFQKNSLAERKEVINRAKRGTLFVAAKGAKIVFDKQGGSLMVKPLERKDILSGGSFTAGQNIIFLKQLTTINKLHENVIEEARQRLEVQMDGDPQTVTISSKDLDIAIVGMGGIFPDSQNISVFWQNILAKFDAIKEVPEKRWNRFLHYDPLREAEDKTYCKIGGFITDYRPDPLKYKIVPNSVASIDPLQFMTLDVIQEAMEDSGYDFRAFNRDRTGVFIGNCSAGEIKDDYNFRVQMLNLIEFLNEIPEFQSLPPNTQAIIKRSLEQNYKAKLPALTEDSCPGMLSSIIAGRAANVFNLRGGNYTLDGACASSLTALEVASRYLRSGELDMAIAGGADRCLNEHSFVSFCKAGTLSERGSFPFDERAGGFVQGEGAGVVILKRLEDAIRDNDKIYAVIKGIGFSSDGRGKGLTAPNINGQILAIERCYQKTSFTPETLRLIEAHGTSTQLGDSNEINALDSVWSKYTDQTKICAIGSVKSNIGHLKGAAGIAGLIKTALAISNKIILPSINFRFPNPKIPFESSHFYVNTDNVIWNKEAIPRRAGVNAFGFGGINYHVALEEYNQSAIISYPTLKLLKADSFLPPTWEVLTIGGDSVTELKERLEVIKKVIPYVRYEGFASFVYNCNLSHAGRRFILSMVISDSLDAAEKLNRVVAEFDRNPDLEVINNEIEGIYYFRNERISPQEIGFLFPGQGSQYIDMAKEIVEVFPQARTILKRADAIFRSQEGTSLEEIMFTKPWTRAEKRKEQVSKLNSTEYTQPALTTVNLIYLSLLESLGVKPAISCGHSLGEYAALYCAGYFDFDSVIKLISMRGRELALCGNESDPGTMASVSADHQTVAEMIRDIDGYLIVSNFNSYKQTVISGDIAAVEDAIRIFSQQGINAKRINVSNAFHSDKVGAAAPMIKDYIERYARISIPTSKVMSNATGELYPDDSPTLKQEIALYLSNHVKMPVRFLHNIENMYREGIRLFIEVGPKSFLKSFVDDILTGKSYFCASMDNYRRPTLFQLYNALAMIAALGVELRWENLYAHRNFSVRDVDEWLAEIDQMLSRRGPKTEPGSVVNLFGNAATTEAGGLFSISGLPVDHEDFQRYLRERRDFIQEFIKLDYSYHAGTTPEYATSEACATTGIGVCAPQTGKASQRGPEDLLDMIGELTGYPVDILRMEMDLETDLGMDSLKIMDLYRRLSVENQVALTPFEEKRPTIIADLYHLIQDEQSKTPGSAGDNRSVNGDSSQKTDITNQVIQIISKLTGYPVEMLDTSMDLEADLGVDSLKQLEIYKALMEEFSISLSDFEANSEKKIAAIIELVNNLSATTTPQNMPPRRKDVATPAAFYSDIASQNKAVAPETISDAPVDTRCYRYIYQPVISPLGSRSAGQHWLTDDGACVILADGLGIWKRLDEHLRRRNIRTIILFDSKEEAANDAVHAGDAVVVDLENEEGIASALAGCSDRIATFISLYALKKWDVDLQNRPGVFTADSRRFALGHLHILKQLLNKNANLRVVAASQLGGDYGFVQKPTAPHTAAINAMLKTAKLEYPEAQIKNIDFNIDDGSDLIFKNLWQELNSGDQSHEVGYRGEERIEVLSIPQAVADLNQSPWQLEATDVVIAFGGGSGVTAEVCKEIARRFRSKIYIIGRTEYRERQYDFSGGSAAYEMMLINKYREEGKTVTPREINAEVARYKKHLQIAETMATIRQYGSEVQYCQASVEDRRALEEIIGKIYAKEGRIDLVINGVGVLEDKLLKNMKDDTFLRVFSNKVNSLANIAQVVAPFRPGTVVSFSSVSGRYGSVGQVNYAAGNEVLAKLSAYLNHDETGASNTAPRYRTIIWGPWWKLGMTDNEQLLKMMQKDSMGFIKTEDGVDFLLRELCYGSDEEVGYHGNLNNPFFIKSLTHNVPNRELFGEIVAMEPMNKLVIGKKFDPGREVFLNDHVILGKTIVPGSYILEIFANAAKFLFPDYSVLGFQDVELLIPIDLSAAVVPVDVEAAVEARSSDTALIKVSIYSDFRNEKLGITHRRENFKGRVLLGKSAAPETVYRPDQEKLSGRLISGERVYRGRLSLEGRLFQNIKDVHYLSENECITTLFKRTQSLFSDRITYQPMAGSFMLRDAAFQTVTVWDGINHQNFCIPYKIAKLSYFEAGDQGDEYYCRVYNLKPADEMVTSDVIIFSARGSIIEIIQGLQMYRYKNKALCQDQFIEEINVLQKKSGGDA